MTYEVQQTRWDRIVRRVSGSIGPGSRVRETISELFPMIDVERVPGELLVLGGTRLCWQSTERPAAVAQVSVSQLQNPVGSGAIVTLSGFNITTSVAAIVQSEITETFQGTPVPGLFRDGRLGITRETTAKVASIDNVPTGAGLRLRLLAGVLEQFRDDNAIVTLGPGQALQIGTATANVIMTITYFWRERAAETPELQF